MSRQIDHAALPPLREMLNNLIVEGYRRLAAPDAIANAAIFLEDAAPDLSRQERARFQTKIRAVIALSALSQNQPRDVLRQATRQVEAKKLYQAKQLLDKYKRLYRLIFGDCPHLRPIPTLWDKEVRELRRKIERTPCSEIGRTISAAAIGATAGLAARGGTFFLVKNVVVFSAGFCLASAFSIVSSQCTYREKTKRILQTAVSPAAAAAIAYFCPDTHIQ